MEYSKDIIIVGGGPAGCAAALALRRHAPSLTVAIFEATDFGGRRIGEDLPAPARKILTHLGVWEAFEAQGHRPAYGAASSWGGSAAHDRNSLFAAGGHGWHLDRARFDAMLFSEAERHGAHGVLRQRVRRVQRVQRVLGVRGVRGVPGPVAGWQIETSDARVWRCRMLIDATGRAAVVARRYGGPCTTVDHLVGFARLFDESRATDPRTFVEPFAGGWWHTSGLPGGRCVATCFTDADLARDLGLNSVAGWDARLQETTTVRHVVGGSGGSIIVCPTESRRFEFAADVGWLAVGDAASIYDPLSSHGIAKALQTGAFAAYAAADYLGRRDGRGLRRYTRFVNTTFADFDEVRSRYYREERRWTDRPFWRRRHHQAAEDVDVRGDDVARSSHISSPHHPAAAPTSPHHPGAASTSPPPITWPPPRGDRHRSDPL